MYLYIYEDGTCWQMPLPPTESDVLFVKEGPLRIFCIESGRFQEVNQDGKWVSVPAGERCLDPHEGVEYSFVRKDSHAELTRTAADALTPEHGNSTP